MSFIKQFGILVFTLCVLGFGANATNTADNLDVEGANLKSHRNIRDLSEIEISPIDSDDLESGPQSIRIRRRAHHGSKVPSDESPRTRAGLGGFPIGKPQGRGYTIGKPQGTGYTIGKPQGRGYTIGKPQGTGYTIGKPQGGRPRPKGMGMSGRAIPKSKGQQSRALRKGQRGRVMLKPKGQQGRTIPKYKGEIFRGRSIATKSRQNQKGRRLITDTA